MASRPATKDILRDLENVGQGHHSQNSRYLRYYTINCYKNIREIMAVWPATNLIWTKFSSRIMTPLSGIVLMWSGPHFFTLHKCLLCLDKPNKLAIFLRFTAPVSNWWCSRRNSLLNPDVGWWYNVFAGLFLIINTLTNLQLDIFHGIRKPATPLQLWQVGEGLNDQWYFPSDGTIRSASNDLAISAFGCIN